MSSGRPRAATRRSDGPTAAGAKGALGWAPCVSSPPWNWYTREPGRRDIPPVRVRIHRRDLP